VSLLAYWSFDSGAAVDLTGNGHNGVDTNMSYGAPAKLGAAAAAVRRRRRQPQRLPGQSPAAARGARAGWARAPRHCRRRGRGAVAMVFGDAASGSARHAVEV
jgi:hypothetical protein